MLETATMLPMEAAEKALVAAEAAGVARAALLGAVGIAAPAAQLSFEDLCDLYECAARLSSDDAFGLHVGERTSAPMYGRLGYVVAHSATLDEALSNLARYQPIWTRAAGLHVLRRRGAISLRYWHKGGIDPRRRRQESEQMLATLLAFARGAVGFRLAPLMVRFEHDSPRDCGEHERIFGAPIVFRAPATELLLPDSALRLALPLADTRLGDMIREQAQVALAEQSRREPLRDRLRGLLGEAIAGGTTVSLSVMAAALGIGPRTLQRRLRARGINFRDEADEAHINAAKAMLGEPTPALAQIAFMLGYSQTSAFHRAFHRHTGVTPGAYRRALRAREEPCG